jgi:class 3 adenylate cyclase/tetratricopeptide (TPR) repeat protein
MEVSERKLVTVLFADLVGSTALGGSQDPERTRALLDLFYDAMAEEIERAGGTVEKFAGDAVMAVFGAPNALEDHAERALHAALALLHRTRELDERLELRIGVNTGEVVVGRPREGSSFVTGDPVNVAARLEQGAEPGEILVGERTVTAVRGAFEFEEAQTIDAKGKPGGVACRRLVRALSLMRTRGVSGLRRAFVGREDELGRLVAAYRAAADEDRPGIITILGEAGVGKTRLVRELWERLSGESPEPLRRTGRCLPYGQGITYWPLAEVLREHFRLLDSDPAEVVLERLGEWRLLGLTLGLDVAEGEHPLLVRDRFQDAWAEFFADAAAERPVAVLIEDLHWADDQLLDLLEQLAADVRGPLLLLATARPELLDRRPGWPRAGEMIDLQALSAEESLLLLDELLVGELPGGLRDLVLERAEGNPFFVEEVLETLIDRGLLERTNGSWTLAELPPDFDVPDSVQAVLSARIDLLQPTEKEALQAAAVIGRVFWSGPVYELVQGEPDLRVLEERDFVRRRSGSSMAGEREYAIKHAVTREVAYTSLPKARRAHLHAAFAAWLERLGEDRDDLASLLAHHYAEAVRPEDADLVWSENDVEAARLRAKAVAWLRRAGTLAVTRYERDTALRLFHRALELEPDPGTQAEIWRAIGRTHALNYEGEAFWTAMERSLELSSDRRISAETYAELAMQTATRGGMWPRRPLLGLVDGWIAKALELAEPESTARAKALIAKAMWQWAEGIEASTEASELADRLGEPELRGLAYISRALSYFASVDYDEALVWADRARELEPEIRDPDLQVEMYFTGILPSIGRGDFTHARRFARIHDELNARLSPHHRLHGVSGLIEVEELAGGWHSISELGERAEHAVEQNLATPCIRNSRSLFLCALARLYQGDEDESRRLDEWAQEVSLEGYGLTLAGPRIRLALARGELDVVEELVAAEHVFPQVFHLGSQAALLEGLAALRDRAGTEREAEPLLEPGTYLEPFALRALGLVREDESLIEQALARFQAMGLDWYAEETRRLVAQA